MAINKVSGNILQDNLQRGSNLAIQGNLIYFDVTNDRVGIKTSTPTNDFTVDGVGSFQYTQITTADVYGIFYADPILFQVTSNNFLFDGGNLTLVGNASISDTLTAGNLDVGNVTIDTANVTNAYVGNLTVSSNTIVESIDANSYISALGNISGGNLLANVDVVATSNVYANNGIFSQTVTANDLTISASASIGNLTADTANVIGNLSAGNVTSVNLVSADTIYAPGTSSILSNLSFIDTTISSTQPTANIVLTPTGNSLAIIDVTSGLVLPTGNTSERPASPPVGTLRYNAEVGRAEIYDGSGWEDVVANVTNQVLNGDNSTITFTLDKETSAAAALVAINGVVQLPGTAYTVTGNQITFAQAPVISDTIDIRFL